jgi:hypothetical protein
MGMLDSALVLAEGQLVTNTGDTPSTNDYMFANAQLGDNGQTGENLSALALPSRQAARGPSRRPRHPTAG